jgi:hypothetical protein
VQNAITEFACVFYNSDAQKTFLIAGLFGILQQMQSVAWMKRLMVRRSGGGFGNRGSAASITTGVSFGRALVGRDPTGRKRPAEGRGERLRAPRKLRA